MKPSPELWGAQGAHSCAWFWAAAEPFVSSAAEGAGDRYRQRGLRAGGKEDLHSSSTPTTTPSCPSPTCPGDVVLSLDVEPGDESCSFAYRRRPVYLWCGWCHFPRPHWAPFTVPCLAVSCKQSLPGFSSLTSSWPSVSCEQFSHFGPSAVSLLVTGPTGQSCGAAKAASGLRPLCEWWQHAFLAPRGNSRVC